MEGEPAPACNVDCCKAGDLGGGVGELDRRVGDASVAQLDDQGLIGAIADNPGVARREGISGAAYGEGVGRGDSRHCGVEPGGVRVEGGKR